MTPVTPDEQRLVEAFLAGRSEAETRALVRRLSPPQLPQVAEDVVRVVRARAALSGAVAPRDLVRALPGGEAERVLDVVAIDFDRVLVGGQWRWTMRSGPREQTLVRLAAEGAVRAALAEADSVPTDEAGRTLRELAGVGRDGGRLFRRFAREKRDDRAILQALTWVAPLGGRQAYLAEARRRAGLMAVRDSYAALLDVGVHGRERELEVLREFVCAPADPRGPVPVLAVTGAGGVGKSTLLAALVVPYLDRQLDGEAGEGSVVVVIDFDREVFRADAELELSFEVTRQLGWAWPIAGADFSALRHQAREERRLAGETEFEAEARVLVDLHDLGRRTVVLVLDTFEDVRRDRPLSGGWNDPERPMMEWVRRLRHGMGLAGLRVVVSGRGSVSAVDGVVESLRLPEATGGSAGRLGR
ncbi:MULTISPECIES: ATP-binding protein [unclassified Saccharothrix]|uniref:ATP-binding protein n=1 Tax=unclassified Saccharothrix TaxID=2593673 RepID=UPI00307F2333